MKLVAHLVLMTVLLPSFAWSQSTSNEEPSLGDLARSLRKNKKPSLPVITNDNFSQLPQLIKETEQKALAAGLAVARQQTEAKRPEPAVTCNFSFTAGGAAPASASGTLSTLDLPEAELAKLDGPAVISGDTLQVSVYNGTRWELREITVGLTIVKRNNHTATADFGTAHLVPASAGPLPMLKRPDVTLLYHLKGSAAPFTTTAFKEALRLDLGPSDEWHWAILQARGIPPK